LPGSLLRTEQQKVYTGKRMYFYHARGGSLSTTTTAIIIHSPHSGRSAQLAEAITAVQQNNINLVDVISIADLDRLAPQGEQWKQHNIDLIIAAGGDGLVGGVVTHIAESGLPLGILPLGTSNDIARSLSIPLNISEAAAILANGRRATIDIGIAQPAEQPPHHAELLTGQPSHQQVALQKHGFFAHVLTAGINVQFARLATDATQRQRYGNFTYPYAALEVLRTHTAQDIELRFEGLLLQSANKQEGHSQTMLCEDIITLNCRAFLVAVVNAPIFGGPFQLAIPGASIKDRLLDIVVVEELDIDRLAASITSFFHYIEQPPPAPSNRSTQDPRLYQAERSNIPGLHHVQAKGVFISTNIDPQDLTLDGEVRGQTPAIARIAEQSLQVLVP
jgi:diacylglycerol kinase (ATP)